MRGHRTASPTTKSSTSIVGGDGAAGEQLAVSAATRTTSLAIDFARAPAANGGRSRQTSGSASRVISRRPIPTAYRIRERAPHPFPYSGTPVVCWKLDGQPLTMNPLTRRQKEPMTLSTGSYQVVVTP
jgi:hypothetical protein